MRIVACLFLLSGCVPLSQYQELEKSLSATKAERDVMKKVIDVCESRNKKLKETKKTGPVTPVINETELEEIKKEALSEAERKYKARINRKTH